MRLVFLQMADGSVTEVYFNSQVGIQIRSGFGGLGQWKALMTAYLSGKVLRIVYREAGQFTLDQLRQLLRSSRMGLIRGDFPFGSIPNAVCMAVYATPDNTQHLIVGVQDGTVYEDYTTRFHCPIFNPVAAPSIKFYALPSDGGGQDANINLGQSATLNWAVSNCSGCQISLQGKDYDTGAIV